MTFWTIAVEVVAVVVFGAVALAGSSEAHPVKIGTRTSATTAIIAAAPGLPSHRSRRRPRLPLWEPCIALISFFAHPLWHPGASPGPHSSGLPVGGWRMRLENG